MNESSRSLNSKRNLIYGTIAQIITLLLQFVSRTIFIYFLGSQYLGVNGLYGNILNVLSLAELGIDNVIIFSLYKPIADNDKNTILALLNYYKKIYRRIAFSVLVIGLAVVPFLQYIVNSELEHSKIVLYYILFLINSVVSYFVVYKTALIRADQNVYIINNNRTLFTIIRHIAQTLFLIITRNYTVYLVIQVGCTAASNFMLSKKADKLYPFIKEKCNKVISAQKEIWASIRDAFLYKVSNIMIGNTDNILISILVSTVQVGYYSNYSMFIFNISVVINMLVTAVFSSFGNLYAKGENKKFYELFNASVLFFQWLATACSLCFFTIFNDFITLWIGSEYVFNTATVFVIVLNFYNETILNPLWLYRETMGLFKEIRFVRIFTAAINLVLSVVLGRIFGIFGILLSTFIAKTCTYSWYEPKVILNRLGESVPKYWLSQFLYVILAAISFCITVLICSGLGHGILSIGLKIAVSFLVPTVVFTIACFKTNPFLSLKYYITSVLVRRR